MYDFLYIRQYTPTKKSESNRLPFESLMSLEMYSSYLFSVTFNSKPFCIMLYNIIYYTSKYMLIFIRYDGTVTVVRHDLIAFAASMVENEIAQCAPPTTTVTFIYYLISHLCWYYIKLLLLLLSSAAIVADYKYQTKSAFGSLSQG